MSVQLGLSTYVAVLLAAMRSAAWLMLAPPFSTRMLPTSIKAILALGIAVAVAPSLVARVPSLDAATFVVCASEQVLIGAALGFLTSLLFAAIQAAGDMIDLFGGFSIASAYDPLSSTTTSVFGRYYNLLATTLLFATDGHQLVLRGFTSSYQLLPLDGTLSLGRLGSLLTSGAAGLTVAALQIAGPLIAVLFCADVGLGLLTRVAPALNAFSLGFPIKILLAILLAGLGLTTLPTVLANLVEQAVNAMLTVAGG